MKIVCDLDGVLCSEETTFERALAKPKMDQIKILNMLYDAGHSIVIHTARSWAELEMTIWQLKGWGVRHHSLICGKPIADILIDDRSLKSLGEVDLTAAKVGV